MIFDEVCGQARLPEAISAPSRERERLLGDGPHLLDPVEAVEGDEDVVVRAERLAHEIGVEGDGQRLPQECLRLAWPVIEDEALRVECARENGGETELFRDVERELDALGCGGSVPGEEVQASKLRGQLGNVGVGLVAR